MKIYFTILLFLIYFFGLPVLSAQDTPLSIAALETRYASASSSEKTTALRTLNKAYQDQADWFFKTPQFNNDSTLFYFNKAVTLLENTQPAPNDLLAELYTHLCAYRMKRTEYVTALEMSNKALIFLGKIPSSGIDKLLHYNILWNAACAEILAYNNSKRGLDLYNLAVTLLQSDSRPEIQAMLLKDKGAFYYYYLSLQT